MHELSLCRAIADTALDHAKGRRVDQINLRIGHFRQVVPDTLLYCWGMRPKSGALANCQLHVDYVPATVRCSSCGAVTTLEHPIRRCGTCDSIEVTLITGEEFLIESIDLATES